MSKEKKTFPVETMRHSCSHILAQAVVQMFPEAKLAIGPDVENGFYYDFDLPRTLIPEDLALLEKKMRQIFKQTQKFAQKSLPVDEAISILHQSGQTYKVEMAEELKKQGENQISFYENIAQNGEVVFIDMCKGPHVEHSGQVGAFKLTSIAGAYWRGRKEQDASKNLRCLFRNSSRTR